MELTDVRRLTGRSLLLDGPGAAAEAVLPAGREGMVVALWRGALGQLLEQVGWGSAPVRVRPYAGGASLALGAPPDALYAATELIEAAWDATAVRLEGGTPDLEAEGRKLLERIAEECDPRLLALYQAADRRKVTFLHGEDQVSLGTGTGCHAWPEDALPEAEGIDWSQVGDVPIALVSGTNGKSTTVRLAAAIGAAAGKSVGLCSSDWVKVAGELVDEGDYSGPGGARLALRDRRTELAVLEVARGGLMRRGLTVPRARVCLITNVAADHLGDYGITDVESLADAKFLLSRAVAPGGRLVLNADDPLLLCKSMGHPGPILWFSLEPEQAGLPAWLAAGGEAAFLEEGHLVLARGGERQRVLAVNDFPLGMKGAARFNLANALGAIGLAASLGLPVEAMAEGLAGFRGSPEDNPGRGNFIDLGGVTVLVDFAHNPHGVAALIEAVEDLPAERRLFLLGQAGDRRDEDIRALVETIWRTRPERIIVKEMEAALRGRAAGEVPDLIVQELLAQGAAPETIGRADTEVEAVRNALAWAKPGDFLILLLHTQRKAALEILQGLQQRNWQPGQAIET